MSITIKTMRSITLFTLIASLLLQCTAAMAQRPDNDEREKWFKEMRDYKHSFLAKELDLSRDQQRKFFPLYDDMEDETFRLMNETRQLEEKVTRDGDNVSDIEYEKAAEALFEQKSKEGEIEKAYMKKFQPILTKKQLFMLKGTERKFTRDIMKHHRRLRSGARK